MTWWCAALDEAWTWAWRPYPGVWLFVVLLAGPYIMARLRWRPRHVTPDDEGAGVREWALFAGGVLALWIATDWPLGTLSAGYLLSARIGQFLLLALIGPPLILLGTPRWLLRRLVRGRRRFRLAKALSRPLVPLVVYHVVMVASHLPVVVDGPARAPLGTFVIDMMMIGAGFVFWWPALGRLPELDPMGYPGRIGYLLLSVFLPTVPAAFFTFSQFPIYALYELAPRVHGIEAVTDQRVAGLLMKVGGGFLLFTVMSVMFFRWYAREESREHSSHEVLL